MFALLVCDVQPVFSSRVPNFGTITNVSKALVSVFQKLKLPIFISEQVPTRFGNTIADVTDLLDDSADSTIFPKTAFSAISNDLLSKLQERKMDSVVIVGCESHICVLQSTLALQRAGFSVSVVEEGVGSQREHDHRLALEMMGRKGADIHSVESLVFQILGDSKHPSFRDVGRILKGYRTSEKL
eukprot:gnl/Dysnectes_brevis/1462_a1656_2069.p1 GENE.gnl/Dysnectes_brevis/1462_a1656_2069~~gnl/Dysnectes_brevis/1462_a1656_2069.p1  ORF type:complete len:185 (+),score=6.19 gnl/Dysnectes_brevis/1462_a1656_2069:600-1154(+)